jgi:hypothetical protein
MKIIPLQSAGLQSKGHPHVAVITAKGRIFHKARTKSYFLGFNRKILRALSLSGMIRDAIRKDY